MNRLISAGWMVDDATGATVRDNEDNLAGERAVVLHAVRRDDAGLTATVEISELASEVWAFEVQTDRDHYHELRAVLEGEDGTTLHSTSSPDVGIAAHDACTVDPLFTSCKTKSIRSNSSHECSYGAYAPQLLGADFQMKDSDNGDIIRQGHLGRNEGKWGSVWGLYGHYHTFVFNTRFDAWDRSVTIDH